MKKTPLVTAVFFIAVFSVIGLQQLSSKIAYPDPGYSGDTFTNATCAYSGCHPGTAVDAYPGLLTLNIGTGTPTTPLDASFTYDGNTQYNIQFRIDTLVGSYPFYGFELSVLNNNTGQAGALAVGDSFTKWQSPVEAAGREYISHKGAGANRNWKFKWTSPPAVTGPVTFFYAFNAVQYDTLPPSVPVGQIYKGSVTINPNPSAIGEIPGSLTNFSLVNPVANELTMSFDLKEANQVQAQLYSLDGALIQNLLNDNLSSGFYRRSFNTQALPQGIYLVKVEVNGASIVRKIVKQ